MTPTATEAPRRCEACNGNGLGELVCNGRGAPQRERCGACNGSGRN